MPSKLPGSLTATVVFQPAGEDMTGPNQLTEADENILVDLQDSSFTVTIEVPGTEGFELQVRLLN